MRNFNGGGNMKNMMKQVQKLQKDMEAKREEVANQEFEVSSARLQLMEIRKSQKSFSTLKLLIRMT